MYFVSEKGRFYRWAVHTKPVYRYFLTVSIFFAIMIPWFVGINTWLIGLLLYEQAAEQRAGQQKVDACIAERLIVHKEAEQERLHKKMQALIQSHSESKQVAFIFDTAQKAGLSLESFAHEKEKQKEWRTKKYKSLSLNGMFDQSLSFLNALGSSGLMIQCKELTLQKEERGCCVLQCRLELISCEESVLC